VLLVEAARRTGLDAALSAALEPWRKPQAVHDPGAVLLDLAMAVTLGGDCLCDVAILRAEPTVFGPVASDPTVSRLVDTLVARQALAQLPVEHRRGRRTLIRTESAGGTHEFLNWVTRRGRWLSYSVGMVVTDVIHQAVLKVPATAWTPAVEPGGEIRDGAWIAELAGAALAGRPTGMRLIVRKERPHTGAHLRITDADGMRLTYFATNTKDTALAALELRHRRRARAEARIYLFDASGSGTMWLWRIVLLRCWYCVKVTAASWSG
jgi:Transposase DDE domain group 1